MAARAAYGKHDASARRRLASKPRIAGYDICKTLAMYLVVLLHSSFYTGLIPSTTFTRALMTLTVVCVPLFIAVNGALLMSRPLDVNKHVVKTARIFAFTLLWRIIHIAVFYLLGANPPSASEFVFMLFGGNVDGYLLGHFWFLNALIALYLVFPLVKAAWDSSNRFPVYLVTGLLIAVAFFLDGGVPAVLCIIDAFNGTHYQTILTPLDELNIFGGYGYLLVYFIGGGLVAETFLKHRESKTTLTRIAVVVLLLALLSTGVLQYFQHEALKVGTTTKYGYQLPSTLAATLALLWLCLVWGDSLKENGVTRRAFTWLGANTLSVYFLHMFALVGIARLQAIGLLKFADLGALAQFFLGVLVVFATFALLSAIGAALKRVPLVKVLFRM